MSSPLISCVKEGKINDLSDDRNPLITSLILASETFICCDNLTKLHGLLMPSEFELVSVIDLNIDLIIFLSSSVFNSK